MRYRVLGLATAVVALAALLGILAPGQALATPDATPAPAPAATAPIPSYAVQLIAVSSDRRLVTWASNDVGQMVDLGPVSLNDPTATQVIAMAVRPATGQVFVLLDSGRLGTLNAATRQVTLVSQFPLAVDVSGGFPAMSFDPVQDTLRIIDWQGFNYRVNPDTAAVTQVGRAVWNCAFGSLANTNPNPGATTSTTLATDLCSGLLRVGGQNGVAPPPDSGVTRQVAVIPVDGSNPPMPINLLTSSLAIPPGADGSRLGYMLAAWFAPGMDAVQRFGPVDLATGAFVGDPWVQPPTVQGGLGPIAILPIGVLNMETAAISVNRSAGSLSTLVVRSAGGWTTAGATVRTVDGTARAGIDYVAVSQPVSFAQGVLSVPVQVTLLNPPTRSGDRYFDIELANPSANTVIGPPISTRVTIRDDGPSVVSMAKPAQSVKESAGEVAVRIIRTGNPGQTGSVEYRTLAGTALPGVDYVDIPGAQLTFGAGEMEKTVTVDLLQAAPSGVNRTFQVQIVPLDGLVLGTPSATAVTIIGDLAPPQVNFAFSAVAVQDTDSYVTLLVNRSGTITGESNVDFDTGNGTAIAGTNYVAREGTLAFAAGQAQARITVPILRDPNQTSPLSFTVTLSNPQVGGTTLGAPAVVTVTILNTGEPTVVRMATSAGSTPPGPRVIQVPVLRLGNVAQQASVFFNTRPGTALPGQDYLLGPGIVIFQPGQSRTTIPITLVENGSATTNRDFFVDLGAVSGGTLGTPSTTRVTIVYAGGPPTVQFESNEVRVSEAAASVTVQVSRIGNTAGASTVQYRTEDRTAVAGTDYTATTGTLTFPPGVSSLPVTVQILNQVEPQTVTFAILLDNPTSAGLGAPNEALVDIVPEYNFLPQIFKSAAGGW